MSLLSETLFIKPQPDKNLFYVIDSCDKTKLWANKATVDVLKSAELPVSQNEVENNLVKLGYDCSQIKEKFKPLWEKLKSSGLISLAPNENSHRLCFVNSLPCENQIDNLTVCLTDRCNYNCLYCYNEKKERQDFPYELLRRVLEHAINECGVLTITFTGGEPLLYPHFLTRYHLSKSITVFVIF